MTTPSPAFPRYFKRRISLIPPIRFDNATDFGIYPATGKRSDMYRFCDVVNDLDWTEIPEPEAIALLTARNGGGE